MLPASRDSLNAQTIAVRQCCRYRAPLAASSATLPFGKSAYKMDKYSVNATHCQSAMLPARGYAAITECHCLLAMPPPCRRL